MRKLIYTTILLSTLASCMDVDPSDFEQNNSSNTEFNLQSSSINNLFVKLTDRSSMPMSGVMIELLNSEQDQLFKIFTDENGIVNQNINIPTAYTGVTMRISHIGLPEYFWLEKSINGFSFELKL